MAIKIFTLNRNKSRGPWYLFEDGQYLGRGFHTKAEARACIKRLEEHPAIKLLRKGPF